MNARKDLRMIAGLYDAKAIAHSVRSYTMAKTTARVEQLAKVATDDECLQILEVLIQEGCVRIDDGGRYELVQEPPMGEISSEADALLARHMSLRADTDPREDS